jgi:hypothetical protein
MVSPSFISCRLRRWFGANCRLGTAGIEASCKVNKKSKPRLLILSVAIYIAVVLSGCVAKHEEGSRITARHLAVLCDAVVGYYESNGSFPDHLVSLTRDPKGRRWGGDVLQNGPEGLSIRLVPIDSTSVRIEADSPRDEKSPPQWLYMLRVAIVTPTNHHWTIQIVHAPDRTVASDALHQRGLMNSTDWTVPIRSIQYTIQSSQPNGAGSSMRDDSSQGM